MIYLLTIFKCRLYRLDSFFPWPSHLFSFVYLQYEHLLAQSITITFVCIDLRFFFFAVSVHINLKTALHYFTTTLQRAKWMQTLCLNRFKECANKSSFSKLMETSARRECRWNASKSLKHNSINGCWTVWPEVAHLFHLWPHPVVMSRRTDTLWSTLLHHCSRMRS